MAPRTRSNRIEKLEAQRLISSGLAFNDKGLCALPDEIYLEIVSYFSSPSIFATEAERGSYARDSNRHGTLLSLTKTCRNLRRVFLPYCWQQIEVLNGMKTSRGILNRAGVAMAYNRENAGKWHAEELIRQLETVTIRNRQLAQYVQSINIYLLQYSQDTVLKELARCMTQFPNLRCVQFEFIFSVTCDFFANYSYPSIREMRLSRSIMKTSILQACPNVLALSTPIVTYQHLPHLSRLRRLETASNYNVSEFSIYLKDLEDLTIDNQTLSTRGYDVISSLDKLTNIHTIRLLLNVGWEVMSFGPSWVTHPRAQEWSGWVQKFLKASPKKPDVIKRVIITQGNPVRTTVVVVG